MFRNFILKKYFIMICLTVLLLPISAQALSVTFHAGDVKIIRRSRKIPIKMGTKLRTGDIIKTGKNGIVEIVYKDRSKIIIREKSTVKIGNSAIKNSNNTALLLGNITAKFSKLQKKRKVYTPTSVASIRGTEFNVKVSKNGDSRIDLSEGKLTVNNTMGTVNIKQNENTATNVGEAPDKNVSGKTKDWSNKQDHEFEKNPKENTNEYKKYINSFKKRNRELRKEIAANKKDVRKAKTKEDLVKAEQDIDDSEEKIEDDMILNDTANGALQIIVNNFKKRKNKIYRDFERLKRESNRVLQVQRQSYRDIQAVRRAHKKAYQSIMGGFKSDKDKIKGSVDFDSVKPKFKKKMSE
jgi:hypothetical protein